MFAEALADRTVLRNGKGYREGIHNTTREAVRSRDDETCHYCRRRGDRHFGPDGVSWHIDHKHPVSLGGTNDLDNLVLACRACNLDKGVTLYEEYRPTSRQPQLLIETWRDQLGPLLHLVVVDTKDGVLLADPRKGAWLAGADVPGDLDEWIGKMLTVIRKADDLFAVLLARLNDEAISS